jgi:hypothetical protein
MSALPLKMGYNRKLCEKVKVIKHFSISDGLENVINNFNAFTPFIVLHTSETKILQFNFFFKHAFLNKQMSAVNAEMPVIIVAIFAKMVDQYIMVVSQIK